MSDRWLSVEEIAEYLGVSKDTVLVGFGSSKPMKLMSGCAPVALQRMKVEAKNERLANGWFWSP